jgi:hypothetical protein
MLPLIRSVVALLMIDITITPVCAFSLWRLCSFAPADASITGASLMRGTRFSTLDESCATDAASW